MQEIRLVGLEFLPKVGCNEVNSVSFCFCKVGQKLHSTHVGRQNCILKCYVGQQQPDRIKILEHLEPKVNIFT